MVSRLVLCNKDIVYFLLSISCIQTFAGQYPALLFPKSATYIRHSSHWCHWCRWVIEPISISLFTLSSYILSALTLQGNFTNWNDGKPLRLTSWMSPKHRFAWNYYASIEVLIAEGGEIKTMKQATNSSFHSSQPLFSFADNCTAGRPSEYQRTLLWFVIPCDESFNATYVCQKEKNIAYMPLLRSLMALNKTCDKGWFLMEGTQKCYTLLATNTMISFVEAQHTCENENSSIFSVLPDFAYFSLDHNHGILDAIRTAYFQGTKLLVKDNDTFISQVIFGNLLIADTSVNKLAISLYLSLAQEPKNNLPLRYIKVFAFLGSYCGIIEYNYAFTAAQLSEKYINKHINAWGAKYRSCSQLVLTDTIVCEKASKSSTLDGCIDDFFTCGDRTCILTIYKCDYIYDCFDGSDEQNCIFVSFDSFSNETVSLPCQLNSNCSVPTGLFRLPLHYVCDGIFSTSIFVDEKKTCQSFKVMRIVLSLNSSDMWYVPDQDYKADIEIFEFFLREKNILVRDIYPTQAVPNTSIRPIYKRRKVLCSYSGTGVYIDQRCTASKHNRVCDHGFTKEICQDMLCPGMFKCKDYYCLHMSAVCDGQLDCLYGDDEKFCNSLVCPGFLKCRGEMRCVGVEEICDGTIDCRYTFDDELLCNSCPDNCECRGYMIVCLSSKNISNILYARGFQMTGSHNTIEIHASYLQYIVFIDLSSCSLSTVSLTSQSKLVSAFLLFLNFSMNDLSTLHFLTAHLFSNILTLDLSSNMLVYININLIKLQHLIVLYLNYNPLKEINLGEALYNFRLLIFKKSYYNSFISFTIPGYYDVAVSDSSICCFLPSTANCISENKYRMCFGLFHTLCARVVGYILTIISVVTMVILLLKIIADKSFFKSRKTYFITKFNYMFADLFSILYLSVLLVADASRVNVITWRRGIVCVFLRVIIYSTLQASLIFKTLALIVVVLKIRFPFKHQLRDLKYVPMALPIIWILILSLQIHDLIDVFNQFGGSYLDMVCSCLDCHKTVPITQLLARFVDVCFILSLFIAISSAYYHLSQKRKSQAISSTKPIRIVVVMVKMTMPFSLEVPFRVTMLVVGICKYYIESLLQDVCLAIIVYLVPLNIITTNLLNILNS